MRELSGTEIQQISAGLISSEGSWLATLFGGTTGSLGGGLIFGPLGFMTGSLIGSATALIISGYVEFHFGLLHMRARRFA